MQSHIPETDGHTLGALLNITDDERLYGTLESVTLGVQHIFSILDTTASLAISTYTMPVPGRGLFFFKKEFFAQYKFITRLRCLKNVHYFFLPRKALFMLHSLASFA